MHVQTVKLSIDESAARKAHKFWPGDMNSIFVELLQNAFRAGAKTVEVVVEPGWVSVTDDGAGVADPSVLLRFGGSDWSEETRRTQDAAGMGVFCLAGRGCEVASRVRGAAKGWRAEFTREVFAGDAEAEVTWSDDVEPGTRFRFPLDRRTTDPLANVMMALRARASYAPLSVTLTDATEGERRTVASFGKRDFLHGAERIEDFGAYRVGVFEAERMWRDMENIRSLGVRGSRGWVNFHGLVVKAEAAMIEPAIGEAFVALVDLRRTDAVHMTLPQRNGVIENQAWEELRANARRTILRHIATLDEHGFGHDVAQEARALGIELKDAAPVLRVYTAPVADAPYRQRGEFGPAPSDGFAIVMDADLDACEAQCFEAVRGKIPGERVFFEPEPAFEGYAWYDRLAKISEVSWRVRWQGGEALLPAPGEEKPAVGPGPMRDYEGPKEPEQIETIEAIVTVSENGASQEHVLAADFLILAEDYGSETLLLITREAKQSGRLDRAALIDLFMRATFAFMSDPDADSYWRQEQDARAEATIAVNRLLLSPREAALEAVGSAVFEHVLSDARPLTSAGESVTIVLRPDGNIEVSAQAA